MKKTIRWVLFIAVVAAAGYYGWYRFYGPEATAKIEAAQKAAARRPAIPVSMAQVQKADFPVSLTGPGTVQAFNTVTVRSRVDGQLKKLSFKEGQDVQAGELLAQIDPDPFRTQVEQLEAKKAQDEAQEVREGAPKAPSRAVPASGLGHPQGAPRDRRV